MTERTWQGRKHDEPWTRTWRNTRLPRFAYTHRVSVVDVRSLDHHSAGVDCRHLPARLARTQSSAATALRALAPDCIPSRPPHALSRAGIAAASACGTTAAVPHDPAHALDDGGATAPPARRASLTAAARAAATRVAALGRPPLRF